MYGEIRRYAGLLANFEPVIFCRDLQKNDVEYLKKVIGIFKENVPGDMRNMFYITPVYVNALETKCDEILRKFDEVENQERVTRESTLNELRT